jgi:hypothetical protein
MLYIYDELLDLSKASLFVPVQTWGLGFLAEQAVALVEWVQATCLPGPE